MPAKRKIERRNPKYGKPDSQKAKALGRRQNEFRELRPSDIGKIIDRSWLNSVREIAKIHIGEVMDSENVGYKQAIKILRTEGKKGIFAARSFIRENAEYTPEVQL